jgi:hypothetical protein
MNEQEVTKAVEKMYQKLNPKGGPSKRYFRRFIRKNRIKKLFSHD